jgi:hypothetical protein
MENLIPAHEFCVSHNIEISFISILQESGLIEITTVEETVYIHRKHLKDLEKMVRLYYDLDINLEGIETITYLLRRLQSLQEEITDLKNRLRVYETP